MDVLVVGGSVFVGRAVVLEALARGDRVTVFNRGLSGSVPDEVEVIVGDRTADLSALAGRRFDLVVDTCGYVPADVGRLAALLEPTCGQYVFVSTINVYPGWPSEADYYPGGVFDGEPDATRESVPPEFVDEKSYGWLKVGCERAVERAFGPSRSASLRAGAIVGPYDSRVGRLPWWVARFGRGGDVLVPGTPASPISLIDARDLADFALSSPSGTFECGGPAERDTWDGFVGSLTSATGSDAQPVWVDDAWLAEQGVEPWTEVPLWIPPADGPGVWAHDPAAAVEAGLRFRPLAETIADTWTWMQSLPRPWTPTEATRGLSASREAALLTEHAKQS